MHKKLFHIRMLLLAVWLLPAGTMYAHGGEKHGETAIHVTADTALVQDSAISQPVVREPAQAVATEEHTAHLAHPATVHASLDDFPNKHPLFVHFAIMLLFVAAAVQLCNVIFTSKALDWVTTISTLIGLTTAFYVTRFAHPHTSGLTPHAQLILDQHDFYAYWTIYLGGAALIAQLVSQFAFKGRRWSVLIVAHILTGAAYTVAMAGYYGAQLVHIEGIGLQGRGNLHFVGEAKG